MSSKIQSLWTVKVKIRFRKSLHSTDKTQMSGPSCIYTQILALKKNVFFTLVYILERLILETIYLPIFGPKLCSL